MNASSIAKSGIAASLARLNASASNVANVRSSEGSVGLADEAINQMVAKRDAEANVRVLQTAFDMERFTLERFG